LNWEIGAGRLAEDIESWRQNFTAALSGEHPAVQEVAESVASDIQSAVGAGEPEILINALSEPVAEPPQQNDLRKKRGRPRKSRPDDEEREQASEPPRPKRGRPSNAEREAKVRRLAAQEEAVEEPTIHAGPPGMTDELSPTSPPQVARIATSQNRQLQRSTQRTPARSNNVPLTTSSRPRQTSADQVAPQRGSDSRQPVTADEEDESLFVENVDIEQPHLVRPEELGGLDDGEDIDQNFGADEQPAGREIVEGRESTDDEGSEDDDEEEDEDEHMDETEIQLEPMANDRHRLYEHWHKIREVMREVAKHRGSTVRIRDEEFQEVLQACKDATTSVSDLAANANPDLLDQTVVQCRDAIARARSICGNGEVLADSREIRKRGFHVFKHLLPTLAKLLRAAIKAFERVDQVDVETDQIPLGHLSQVIELLSAVVQCGESAHKSYQALSKPIKQDVHRGITMHLRELLSSLTASYTTEIRRREEQQLNEELEREITAREEQRERQVQWRKLELHNQEKWKCMNKVRFDVSKNSGDVKKHLHLRSCGMQLVQTDADGQPYLPTTLRGRRGIWTEHESTTLETSLRNNFDTPEPLRSMVFEKIISEECVFRRPLANKNVLEIVLEANEIKDFWINWSRDTGVAVDEWVQKIPRWMDPPMAAAVHDNGSSAEDAIEIE
jgi:hypothetical protein